MVAAAGIHGNFQLGFGVFHFVKRPFFNRLAAMESRLFARSQSVRRPIFLPGSVEFANRLLQNTKQKSGVYRCAGCQLLLFTSQTQIASGVGWASFRSPVSDDNVEIIRDHSLGFERCEVICPSCRSHLGYLFEDLLAPEERRYSVMLAALKFVPGK